MALAAGRGGAGKGGTGGGSKEGRDDGDGPGLMDKAELKPLLHLSRRRPVSCTVVLTKDRQGVVLLDRKVKPRKLAATLKARAKAAGIELDPATLRFGRASVDGSSDSARVVFTVHKDAPAAMGRAMLPLLRPVGFQRCEFVTDAALESETEDGEDDADEEAEAGEVDGDGAGGANVAGQVAPVQAPAAGAAPSGPVPGPAAPAAASPSRAPLSAVVPPDVARGVAAAVAADPSCRPALAGLLAQVRAGVEAGDLGAAERGMAALRQALDGPAAPPAEEGRAAGGRAAGAGQLAPASPAPAAEPRPMQASATLADLARAWTAQQGQASAAGQGSTARQGGPKTPAPPASKSVTLAGRSDDADLTAPDRGTPVLPGGDEDLATPVLSGDRWAPPPEALPVPSGQLPFGLVPEVQGPSPLPGGRTLAREGLRAGGRGVGRFLLTKPNSYLMVAGAVLLVAMELMPRADEDAGEATVTLRRQGEGGQPGREVARLHMDPSGALRAEAGGHGAALGQMDPSGEITLTPAGEAHIAERAKGAQATPAPTLVAAGFPGGAYDPMGNWTGPGTPDEAAPQPAAPGPAAAAAPPRPGTPGLPQELAPGQGPQQPAWLKEIEGIETFDADEREFIEAQAQGGMRHAEIVRALAERRRGGAGAVRGQGGAGQGGKPGFDLRDQEEAKLVGDVLAALPRRKEHQDVPWTEADAQSALAALRAVRRGEGGAALPLGTPTPRDGVPGGKPTGTPEPFPDRAKADKQEGHGIQEASLEALAAAGYRVHLQPWVLQSDGLAGFHGQPHVPGTPPPPDPDPDARLGDNIADVLAPKTSSVDQVRKGLSDKVDRRQALHLVLNLTRAGVTRQEVEAILRRKPIEGLRELFIIQQDGAIYRVFPNPEMTSSATSRIP